MSQPVSQTPETGERPCRATDAKAEVNSATAIKSDASSPPRHSITCSSAAALDMNRIDDFLNRDNAFVGLLEHRRTLGNLTIKAN